MDLWVFDNDNTLYDDSKVGYTFFRHLTKYVAELLMISEEDVSAEILKLKQKLNIKFSIIALVKEYDLDFEEVVQQSHLKVDLTECGVDSNDQVRWQALNSIIAKKIVFTNNASSFAQYVLSYIGLSGFFSDIIGMKEMNFLTKPHVYGYKVIEKKYSKFDRIIFCDDRQENLDIANSLGWITILFNPQQKEFEINKNHFVIKSFKELETLNL